MIKNVNQAFFTGTASSSKCKQSDQTHIKLEKCIQILQIAPVSKEGYTTGAQTTTIDTGGSASSYRWEAFWASCQNP